MYIICQLYSFVSEINKSVFTVSVDEHLSDGLDSLRNKFGKETAGDYVCHKIGHEVLSDKPARVTLVTSASG